MENTKFKNEEIKAVEPEDLNLDKFSSENENIILASAKKFGRFVFDILKVVLISLAIILPVRMFLIQPFYVEGASMEPNFHDKEYLIIDEISYRFQEPQRGEVIVFRNPNNTRQYYIKRVIGLPGEKVEIKSGKVFINEQVLEEDYISDLSASNFSELSLADDEYFVLGDNRPVSQDSRYFKALNKDNIIGRVWFRGWPVNKISTFNLPNY
ncbi:signal peptidase I [Patescibacteria group bacterium]|jgi:signal peptidase I|nr:signal peptidase I [Patescibacteria group bacterium]